MPEKLYEYEKIPRKRMAALALIRDEHNNILIVKPTYRDSWLLPGGAVEENESPLAACIREIKEEIGLDILPKDLICVDYLSYKDERTEALHFVFNGGVLSAEDIKQIQLPENELSAFKFVSLQQSLSLVSKVLAGRMEACISALNEQKTLYLEDEKEIF